MSSEKKHKGGYELLKEKYAALEKERDKLKEELSMQIAPDFETFKRVEKERDEMNARNNELCNVYHSLCMEYNNQQKRIRWLLDHASWFTLRKYRKQFEKGGK